MRLDAPRRGALQFLIAEEYSTMQSKITELEDRNGELIKEVKRLQQENQNLDSRMTALVRLVHQKNAEMESLKTSVSFLVLPHTMLRGRQSCMQPYSDHPTYLLRNRAIWSTQYLLT